MREALFSAARAVVEAIALRRPLVLALDDIHWADEGMLDLIDHLARWVRGAAAAGLPGPRRAARAAPRLGRRAAQRDHDLARAADRGRDAGAGRGPDAGRRQRRRRASVAAGRRALRRQPAVRRGDGQPPDRGGHGRGGRRCPSTVQSLLAARLDSLDRLERRLLQHAAVVGQTFWEGSLERDRRGGGPRPRPDARLARGEGPAGARAPAAASPASASTPSSTC